MNQQNARSLTLYDLLGRHWARPAAVEAIRFSADGSAVAFACADGTVAIGRTADAEAPETRIRISGDLGQTVIRPRKAPPEPLIVTAALAGRAPPFAALGPSAFVAGGAGGEVVQVSAAGDVEPTTLAAAGAVTALDHAQATGTTAVTDGASVLLSRPSGALEPLPLAPGVEIAAVAFSPSGRHLALAHADGATVWTIGTDAALLDTFDLGARPTSLCWSADGAWLAAPLVAGGFGLIDMAGRRSGVIGDFPAAVQAVSWSGPADALMASGAFRIAGWSMRAPPLDGRAAGALITGRSGLIIVETVAAHPVKPLVAAAYANGEIVVAQIGAQDELLVKPSGGSVTALAWSADGRHLAAGTRSGEASLITFPPQLFR